MENVVKEIVNVADIVAGDTVEIAGQLKTVCKSNIGERDFMGVSLFGMTYFPETGYQKVTRVKFRVPTNRGVVLR